MTYDTERGRHRPGYLTIKEAAVRYEVSRAKLHRLVRAGRVETEKDPRDERATLLRLEDLEEIFRFPLDEPGTTGAKTTTGAPMDADRYSRGRLTAEGRARIDAVRARVARGGRVVEDSVEIIREARTDRSRSLYGGTFGLDDSNQSRPQA